MAIKYDENFDQHDGEKEMKSTLFGGIIRGDYLLCPECGELFYRSPLQIRKINYCSYKCSAQNRTNLKTQ